jgi:hypothetical protein
MEEEEKWKWKKKDKAHKKKAPAQQLAHITFLACCMTDIAPFLTAGIAQIPNARTAGLLRPLLEHLQDLQSHRKLLVKKVAIVVPPLFSLPCSLILLFF